MRRETAKGRGGERTGGEQEQAAMELRLLSPTDGQREGDGEGDDVKERNDEKRLRVGRVELEYFETRHGDGGGDTQHGNRRAERDTEPASPAMQRHIARSDQRGLEHDLSCPRQPCDRNRRGFHTWG